MDADTKIDHEKNKHNIYKWQDLNIIYNLELNDRVSIGTQEYLINTLKTNLINGKSEIELLNVVS